MTTAYRRPPGPRTPRLYHGIAFLAARNAMIRRLQRRSGDAFTIEMPGFGRMVLVSNPDLVKQVYTAKPDVLHGGKNPLGEVLGPGSLFSIDEERHLRERRMLLPPFHGDRMRSYEQIIEEEAERAMAAWPEGEPFATFDSFQTITLRVILRTVSGAEGRELAEPQKLLPPMTAIGQRLVTAPFLRRDYGRWSPGGRWRRMSARYRRTHPAARLRAAADERPARARELPRRRLRPRQGRHRHRSPPPRRRRSGRRAAGEHQLHHRFELGGDELELLAADQRPHQRVV